MRTVTLLASIILIAGCASTRTGRVGRQILDASRYSSDILMPGPAGNTRWGRRVARVLTGIARRAAQRRRADLDRIHGSLADALSTSLPGAPQVRWAFALDLKKPDHTTG